MADDDQAYVFVMNVCDINSTTTAADVGTKRALKRSAISKIYLLAGWQRKKSARGEISRHTGGKWRERAIWGNLTETDKAPQ